LIQPYYGIINYLVCTKSFDILLLKMYKSRGHGPIR